MNQIIATVSLFFIINIKINKHIYLIYIYFESQRNINFKNEKIDSYEISIQVYYIVYMYRMLSKLFSYTD